MPVGDALLAELPAEQDDAAFHLAWKIQQSNFNVFDLHANGVYLSQRVLYAVYGFFPFCLPPRHLHGIHQQATAHQYPMSQFLEFVVHGFDQLLAVHSGAQERFQHRQKILSFLESKCAVCHKRYTFILIHSAMKRGMTKGTGVEVTTAVSSQQSAQPVAILGDLNNNLSGLNAEC